MSRTLDALDVLDRAKRLLSVARERPEEDTDTFRHEQGALFLCIEELMDRAGSILREDLSAAAPDRKGATL